MICDIKAREPNVNRFGVNLGVLAQPRIDHQQNLGGQALMSSNPTFPMSFIDHSQAAHFNQLMPGGPINLAPQ
jgi:hypothetical protein